MAHSSHASYELLSTIPSCFVSQGCEPDISGPYRWVRHAFYLSVLLLVVSCAMLAANWFIFGCGLVLFTMMVLRTRIEEGKLVERFGDEYHL